MTTKISEFEIEYAYWLEDMHNAFWRRIDACINIALIILGTSVAASLNVDVFIGLAIALLAAINVVVQPLKKSLNARNQSKKYIEIMDGYDSLSPEQLREKIETYSEHSSDNVGMLTALAYNRAAIVLKLKPSKKYTFSNRLAGYFIGDLPESRS